jgi:hypothetical protein
MDLDVFRRLPETPLPPSPIPFELAYPTWQPPPAPVVTGQIGLVALKVHCALAFHALLVVVGCEHDWHSDERHEPHERPASAGSGAGMAESSCTEGRTGAATNPPPSRCCSATVGHDQETDKPCAARTSRPGARCGGHGRCLGDHMIAGRRAWLRIHAAHLRCGAARRLGREETGPSGGVQASEQVRSGGRITDTRLVGGRRERMPLRRVP